MSRIGRLPVAIPDAVKLHVSDGTIRVEGPKGTLTRTLDPEVSVTVEGKTAVIHRRDDSRRARSVHGLTRKLLANMVQGGDREMLGQTAAAIRKLRPPEPYKGKGVKYSTETIRRKAGKAAAGAR